MVETLSEIAEDTGEAIATSTRMQIAHQTVLHTQSYPSHILLPIIPLA